ncbi:MAG: thiamine phosphate synthase [Hyphomicrobiales bacterium]
MTPTQSRLYLVTPEQIGEDQLKSVFSAIVAAGDIAAVLVRASTHEEKTARAKLLAPLAHDHDIAILIDEERSCVEISGADGVHVMGTGNEFTKARELVGSDMIVGVSAGSSKHAAMEAADAGADYVAFDDASYAKWWAPLFEVPCVALGGADEEMARELALAGVEFICPDETMWQEPDKATRVVKRYCEIFAEIETSQ